MATIACAATLPAWGDPSVVTRVSLTSIGDVPEPKFDVTPDGKRVIQNTPDADVPPSLLYYKENGKWAPLNLGLNSCTAAMRFDGGQDLTLFLTQQPTAAPFLKVLMPQTKEDTAVFMIRNPETKNWRISPVVKVYENGLKSFPKNSLRILSFSKTPVVIEAMNGDPIEVPARTDAADSAHIVPLPPSEQGILSYKVTSQGDGAAPVVIAQTATTYPKDARVNLVTYDADGDDKSQKVKVVVFFELPLKETVGSPGKNGKGAKPPVRR